MSNEGRFNKTAWINQGDHTITLPSGAVIGIRIPDLATLIEAGELPQNLLDEALGYAAGTKDDEAPTKESIIKEREFRDLLVELTVTEPKLAPADVAKVPVEDKDLIVSIALRQRDLDAIGDHIGGLTTSDKFRAFRGLDSIESLLEGA